MYPNPQQALPLPARPNVAQYRTLAKDLVKACRSDDPTAIRDWAARWIENLATLQDAPRSLLRTEKEISAHVDPVEQFARKVFSRGHTAKCALTDAQFVIARAHSFLSWPKFVKHVESLARVSSSVSAFERAVSAIVTGDAVTLIAGVQQRVMDVLLEHGARMDLPGSAGHRDGLVRSCLSNGQPHAAAYLASRGAPLDFSAAAGLGRLDVVKGFFDADGHLNSNTTPAQLVEGFGMACAYGRADVVDFLLNRGMDVDTELRGHGEGHTGLHVAAFHGQLDVVKTLLRRGARVHAIDKTWGTTPLVWALTGWDRQRMERDDYYEVVARLVAAGADVTSDLLAWDKTQANPKMLSALTGEV